jgi:nucleotide-binding universal stress UspA family protein
LWLYDPTLGLDTGPLINPMWDVDARQAAETYAEGLAAKLSRAGLLAEGRGVSGQPGAVIVSAAVEVDADLIVMSTHARGGPVRSILGSVANEVVRQSRRPVLLIHRPSRGHESEGQPFDGAAASPAGRHI